MPADALATLGAGASAGMVLTNTLLPTWGDNPLQLGKPRGSWQGVHTRVGVNSIISTQLQLQLQRFQLQLQFQLRQISIISTPTPTPTPEVSTPTPIPTPANFQNINSNSNSNSNSGVSNPPQLHFKSNQFCSTKQPLANYNVKHSMN